MCEKIVSRLYCKNLYQLHHDTISKASGPGPKRESKRPLSLKSWNWNGEIFTKFVYVITRATKNQKSQKFFCRFESSWIIHKPNFMLIPRGNPMDSFISKKHYMHNGLSIYQTKYCKTTFLASPCRCYILFNHPVVDKTSLLYQKSQQTYYYYRIATKFAKAYQYLLL